MKHRSILLVAEESRAMVPPTWVRYLRIPALMALIGMLAFGLSQV